MGSLLGDGKQTYASFPNTTCGGDDNVTVACGGRQNGVIRVSKDNAITWDDHTAFGAKLPFAYSCLTEVSFRWKNPDFLLKNSDFLLKHLDFITKQVKDAGSIGVLWETEMKGW